MSKILTKYPGWSAVAVAIITGLSTFLFGRSGVDHSSDYAAWAQGIGTAISAIFALWAFLEGEKQRKIDAEKERHKRQLSILALAEAVDNLRNRLLSNFELDDPRLNLHVICDKSILHGFYDAMGKVEVHEIGSAEGITDFLAIQNQLKFLEVSLENYRCGPMNDHNDGVTYQYNEYPLEQRLKLEEQHRNNREDVRIKNVKTNLISIEKHFDHLSNLLKA